VPYGLLALCLLVVWFAAYGQPADVAVDRARVPWYRTKQAPRSPTCLPRCAVSSGRPL
jgi:hypothetical protein